MTNGPLTISAVLPAYNEAANLERTVRGLIPVLARRAGAFEILIIDDGSTDETAQVAARLAAEVSQVRVLRHPGNQGYGAALRTGFMAAKREWIVLLDADGQFDPEDLTHLVAALPGADLVVGYRRQRADPGHRRLFAAVWRLLVWMLLGVRARDPNCGLKLMRTRLIQALDLRSNGALISAEFLGKAARLGAVIVEVPVTHHPRTSGRQTGGTLRVTLRAYYELAHLGWQIRQFGRFPEDRRKMNTAGFPPTETNRK